MKYKEITSFICKRCGWVKGRRCQKCGVKVKPSDSCASEKEGSTAFDCYRPPRPASMTPIEYVKKFGCVDDNFARKTNGRYYCNPAHCHRSWTNKKERDEHLDMAYAILQ
jgi:hypothetical protein